jgi:phage-related holin
MLELVAFPGEFLLTSLVVSAVLSSIKNAWIRNLLASIAAVLGLLWLLGALIIIVLAHGLLPYLSKRFWCCAY